MPLKDILLLCFWINSQSSGFVCGRNAQLITVGSTLYQEDFFPPCFFFFFSFPQPLAWPGRWKALFRCLAPALTLITVSVLFARSTFTARNQSLRRSHYSKKCFLYLHHHKWFPLIGLPRSQPCGHFALSRAESSGLEWPSRRHKAFKGRCFCHSEAEAVGCNRELFIK